MRKEFHGDSYSASLKALWQMRWELRREASMEIYSVKLRAHSVKNSVSNLLGLSGCCERRQVSNNPPMESMLLYTSDRIGQGLATRGIGPGESMQPEQLFPLDQWHCNVTLPRHLTAARRRSQRNPAFFSPSSIWSRASSVPN